KVDHESSIYKGAKMPNMQRLTWTGIAVHAGGSCPAIPLRTAVCGCRRISQRNFTPLPNSERPLSSPTTNLVRSTRQSRVCFFRALLLLRRPNAGGVYLDAREGAKRASVNHREHSG